MYKVAKGAMSLRAWRFITVMLAALSMGLAFSHPMEMPAKMAYGGALWLKLVQSLYWAFGTIGAFIEVGAVLAAAALALIVRGRRPAFGWTLSGALLMAAAHAAWWIWVAPVNAAMRPLGPETLPPDWTALRDQWEYAHAARAVLQTAGLGALVLSIISETPAGMAGSGPGGRV
ncbi:MAG: hypothetical protein Kow0025_24970 [Thermodesulfovibrionales bacterium]